MTVTQHLLNCLGPADTFDFNSTQPLPWRKESRWGRHYESEPKRPQELFRKFAGCHDPDLFAYLNTRNISIGFLCEIDQFLESHPEIGTCPTGQTMAHMINNLPPLDAYRYFIKGYTLPAR